MTPFYANYPKDPAENLRWRIACRERALEDIRFRNAFWQAGMDDPLFFCGAFLWVYEPRAKVKVKPFCIAARTPVVTDRGPVPIEHVAVDDLVWDGESWASHGGSLCMGRKDVIFAYGVYLTKDHKVRTDHGWKMACEGYDRKGVRLPDGYRERWGLSAEERAAEAEMEWRGFDSIRHDRKECVYDLLNCGPRNSFTVLDADGRPLLVHNCPWPHQSPVILAMDAAITDAMATEQPLSLTLKKSRAQGGTYIYLAVQIRRALKEAGFSTGLVTRNEDLVDSRTDSSAVMYKLAWMLDRLPIWMLDGYQRSLSEHTIAIPNGSLWVGYAATGDVARGGRMSMFAFDEPGSEEFIAGNKDYKVMSSVAHVSNCTFLVSTFGVDSGVFYETATDPDNPRVYTLDWKENPEHSKLAYITQDGVAKAVRPDDQAAVEEYIASHQRELRSIERRGHKMEGKVRSPWYNSHCLLPGGTTRFIARELDMDPRGAVGKVFPTDLLDRVKRDVCKPPVWQGTPVFDSESLALKGMVTRNDGPLKLWFRPGPDHSCPLGPFTVGCDIAMGSDGAYSSNSVASGIDDRTGEQVLEYTIKGMPSIKFARNVVGLCRWLRGAFLGWEDSGMAGPFAKEILEVLYYGNVYYRDVEAIGQKTKTRKAGWWNGKDEHKADLFEKMALAMETGVYIIRSEDLIRECGEYEWEKGKIIHQPTKNKGATEKAHGDRCIASGVAYLAYSERIEGNAIDTGEENAQTPEYGSFLWRERRERRRVDSGSPEFGLKDVVSY